MNTVVITLNRESAWVIADRVKEARETNSLNPDAKHTEEKLRNALQLSSTNPVDVVLSQEDVNNILQTMGGTSPVVGLGHRYSMTDMYPMSDLSNRQDEDPGVRAGRITLEMAKDRSHFD